MTINLNSEFINRMNVFYKVMVVQKVTNTIIKTSVLLLANLKMINYMLNQMANLALYLVKEMFGNIIDKTWKNYVKIHHNVNLIIT